MTTIRQALQGALTRAMRDRDRLAMSTCRNALAVLDNATAIPLRDEHRAGAVENARTGVGSADEPGRELSEAQALQLLDAEVRQLSHDARELETARVGAGEATRAQADLLGQLLRRHTRGDGA